MNSRNRESSGSSGFMLVAAMVMLGIAGVTIGAIFAAQITHSRNCDRTYARERAAFLADAGLESALVKLNSASDGNITFGESRALFQRTGGLTASDWGFQTTVSVTNGRHIVYSTGRYNAHTVRVQEEVSLGVGSRSIHALYAHAIFAGNSGGSTSYVLSIGGTASGADFVRGDVYSGWSLSRSGDAFLRLPEALVDTNNNDICDPGELWTNAYCSQTFTNPLTKAQYSSYTNTMAPYTNRVYNNGKYDPGEAFVDTIGNGVYDSGEPFVDANTNGVWDPGDAFIDRNGNGVFNSGVDTVVDRGDGQWDPGEEWTEDSSHSQRVNGKYDPAGGYWSGSTWKTTYKSGTRTYSCSSWPAEAFEDVGDGVFSPAEAYTDQNGIYDAGEQFLDDRNPIYDYGTQARGAITGMPTPSVGQLASRGTNAAIDPPDLTHMYYEVPKTEAQPAGALTRWGNDVKVMASDYGTAKAITDTSRPEHIFVRNPPTSGSVSSAGKTIYGRTYTALYTDGGVRIDDYFLEDPADTTYNTSVSADSLDGTTYTAPMYINVLASGNMKLYYVEGNVYLHHPQVYSMRFRQPDTRITVVARGNITISDEFYYKASYPAGLTRSNMNSTVASNPSDALCLIALKNPDKLSDSGNIYIGDKQFGTGGSIHAMLYAEKDFVDNNLNTVDQQFISVFGNMTAGNQVRINRPTGAGTFRTRLDVTLDERIRNGSIIVPGLPHPVGSQRSITVDTAWQMVPGTWSSWSLLQ